MYRFHASAWWAWRNLSLPISFRNLHFQGLANEYSHFHECTYFPDNLRSKDTYLSSDYFKKRGGGNQRNSCSLLCLRRLPSNWLLKRRGDSDVIFWNYLLQVVVLLPPASEGWGKVMFWVCSHGGGGGGYWSTGPMSFLGGTPSPSRNTSTGPCPFWGYPQSGQDGVPPQPDQDGVPPSQD